MSAILTPSDQDLLGQMARFAERTTGRDEIYINRGYSLSLAAPTLIIVAIGEQANLLDKVLLGDRTPTVPIISPELNDGKF